MALTPAHALFRDALINAGWQIDQDPPLSAGGGPNPSRLQIRRGRLERRLVIYAWNITSEGTGRRKAGRDNLDWRVQTTRSHEGDLLAPQGHLSVGLGWFEEGGVFAASDIWVKHTTGNPPQRTSATPCWRLRRSKRGPRKCVATGPPVRSSPIRSTSSSAG